MRKNIVDKMKRSAAGGLAILLMLTSIPTGQIVYASDTSTESGASLVQENGEEDVTDSVNRDQSESVTDTATEEPTEDTAQSVPDNKQETGESETTADSNPSQDTTSEPEEVPEDQTNAEQKDLVMTQELDGITITLKAAEGVFPTDAVLSVEKIEEAAKVEKIEQSIDDAMTQTAEESRSVEEPKTVEKTYSYDIKVLDAAGNELQPDNEKGSVTVSFTNVEIPTEAEGEEKSIEVYHVDDTLESAEAVTTEVKANEKTVEITPEHFSIYVVTVSGSAQLRYYKGATSAEQYYMISTAEELAAFSEIVNGTTGSVLVYNESGTQSTMTTASLNKNAKLMNNITGVANWIPIGISGKEYTATFDGNGNSITIESLSSTVNSYVGIFGLVQSGATIKNLTVKGTITAKANTACVAGIAGYVYTGAAITNCNNQANITGSQFVGGIVGFWGAGTLSNCTNSGTITTTNTSDAYAGGICGRNGTNMVIDKCSNSGTITTSTTSQGLGGIAGSNLGTIQNCYNTGIVMTGTGSVLGGIAGNNANTTSVIQNCYNWANITGKSDVGGIVGINTGTVKGIYNIGAIYASGEYAGGIVGVMSGGTIAHAYNTGTVYTERGCAGGILGGNWTSTCTGAIKLYLCYNSGGVSGSSGTQDYGGIAGIFFHDTSKPVNISYWYNKGDVKGYAYSYLNTSLKIGTTANGYIGDAIGYYIGPTTNLSGAGGSFGNTILNNMSTFIGDSSYNTSGNLYSWTGETMKPTLSGTIGTTTVTSTEVKDRPYYTTDGNVVRVYANGLPIVVHGYSSDATTAVYWDKNSNGTYDTGDMSIAKKDGTGGCSFSSSSYNIYVYGGGEGVDFSSSAAKISMEGGKVGAIFAGGNGAYIWSANIYVKGGTVGDIYASALNYKKANTTGSFCIYLSGGTVTGNVKGYYDSSSSMGVSKQIHVSGNPSVTGSIDLSTFTDKYVYIDAALTGGEGSIKLSNPSSTAENTRVVYGYPSNLINLSVFSLAGQTLRTSGNFIIIKNCYDQSVTIKLDNALADITSVYPDAEGLYIKSDASSATYMNLAKTATGQYKLTNVPTNSRYYLYYKKGASHVLISGITCKDDISEVTVEYVSIANELNNITSSNKDTAVRKATNYTTTLTPMTGYSLPESLIITCGGVTIPSTDYTYDKQTGLLTIPSAKLTDAIKITSDTAMPYFEQSASDGHYDVYGSGYYLKVESSGDGTKVTWCETENGTYKTLYHKTDSTKNADALTGKITIYGGNNGRALSADSHILMKGGTVDTIYGGSKSGNIENSSITITGGTAGYVYGGSSSGNVTGTSSMNISGRTIITGFVDLSTFTDKRVHITGGISSKSGGIILKNPSANTLGTVVASATAASDAAAKKFVLLKSDGTTLSLAKVGADIVVTEAGTLNAALNSESTKITTDTIHFGDGKATYAATWTGTLLAADGYKLPDEINVKTGGTELTRTTDTIDGTYTYNKVTGEIIIEAESVLGNIDVTAKGAPISYTITYDGNGGTVAGTTSETVNYGQSITFPEVTAPADGWTLVGWSQTYNAVENDSETEAAKKVYKNTSTTDSFSKVDGTRVTLYAIWKTASGNTSLLNGSFEYPVRPQWTNMVVYTGFPQMYWMTTANDKKIELGRPSKNVSASWSAYHVREASDGEQFAELNANSVAALYQVVQTVPGKTLNWGLDHRARSTKESETMELWIGKPTDIAAAINAYKKAGNTVDTACATILQRDGVSRVDNITDDCNAWYTHKGTYQVPEGQTQTTFAFVSRSNPASNSCGNLLDNVYFTMQQPKAKKDITVRTSNGGTASVIVDSTTSNVTGSSDFRKAVEYDSVLKITPFANEGYTYNGAMINGQYKSKAELESSYNSLLFTMNQDTPTEIVLLYAKDSTVSLVANGGTLSSGEQLLVADVSQSNNKIRLAENQPTRNGYLLSGWLVAGTDTLIDASGTVTYTTDGTSGDTTLVASDGTHTASIVTEDGMMLIAQWTVDDASLTKTALTLDADGGIYGEYGIDLDGNQMLDADDNPVIVPLQTEYTIDASYMGDGALVLKTPIRTGYDFLGWKDETTGFTTAGHGVTADSTVTYSIDGSTAKLTVKQDDAILVTKDAPESLTLTAQWAIQKYDLTVSTGNGYQVTDASETPITAGTKVTYGEAYRFKVPTSAGYNAATMTVSYKTPDGESHKLTADADSIYTIPGADITGAMEIIVSGLTDDKAPTGEIQVGTENSNKWNSFWNIVTFDIFFKETQNVTITANDEDGSGVKSIEYYVSETKLMNVAGSTVEGDIKNPGIGWTTYNNGFSIDPNKKMIIYVKITDDATNVTYISTNGLVLDNQEPVITGVENNGTYTGTTEVTITDPYLAENGIAVTNDGKQIPVSPDDNGKFTLVPAKEPYSIKATDKAGNETIINITIGWNEIVVPEIKAKSYNGSAQTADITSNDNYKVTTNSGGTNVNDYDVVLTLKDTVNNAWKAAGDSDEYVVNTEAGTVTCKFAITQADNTFTTALSCKGFTYDGTTAAKATAVSAFGTPEYIYYNDESCSIETTTADGADAAGKAPRNAGTYYVKATVTGTDNYKKLTSDEVKFVIDLASQNKPELTSTSETYEEQKNGIISGVTSAMEYTTDPKGTWTTVSSAQNTVKKIENLAAGTYYVRYAADANHKASEYVTIVMKTGSKIDVTFTAEGCDTETLSTQKVEVTYNSNLSGDTNPAMPAVPDKTGYEAKGWKLSGTENNELVTDITEIKEPVTYVAVYVPKTFTITLSDKYNAGETDQIYEKYQTGFFKDQNCTNQMTEIENAITVPSKTGYTFHGYYTEGDGTGTKVIGADGYFTSNVDMNFYKADGTVYAYWTENSYNVEVTIAGDGIENVTVSGVGDDGALTGTTTYTKENNISITPDAGYAIKDIYVYVNGVEKKHYTDAAIPGFKLSDADFGPGNVDIGINTELVFHHITFKNTEAASDTLDYTILGNTPDRFAQVNGITLPQAEKTGFDFRGWKIVGSDKVIAQIPAGTEGDIILVPVFSNQVYKISYYTDGGTLSGTYPEKYIYGTETTLPTEEADAESGTISRTGYTWKGWYSTEACTGDPVTEISTTDTGNKAFYAKWERITYTVTLPENTIGYTVNAMANSISPVDFDGNYGFKVELAPGYTKTDAFKVITNKGTKTETVLEPTETDGDIYELEHILENKNVTVEGVADITKPNVKITVAENEWREFLKGITFGIFFKDTQTVTITADDAGSGVKNVYYYTSDKELTLEDIAALSDTEDWILGSQFNIEPNNQVVIYAKVIDEAENVTYASSTGIVLDNLKPVISGISNNSTYEKTQYFTVSDSYLKDTGAVTIDGQAATAEKDGDNKGEYKLAPKANGAYTIVAEDKAGNQIAYTVTVNKKDGTLTVTKDTYDVTYGDQPFKIDDITKDGESEIQFTSSDENVAKVDQEGNVTIIGQGKATITLRIADSTNYNAAKTTVQVNVKPKQITVTADHKNKIYGEPDETLTWTAKGLVGDDKLTDITATRKTGEDAGDYAITLSQKSGTNVNYDVKLVEDTYTIQKKDISTAVVKLGSALVDNGREQSQAVQSVTITNRAGDVMTVTYDVKDNQGTKAGLYTMTISGNKNFTGTIQKNFVIGPNADSELDEDSDGNIEIGSGSIGFVIETDGKAPVSELKTDKAATIQMLIENGDLTSDELAMVADGATIDVILKVTDASDTISGESKKQMEEGTSGYIVGQYIDISLFKQITHADGQKEELEQLTTTSDKLLISVVVPDELLNKDAGITRTFYIVRNHDGKVEMLATIYKDSNHTLTFETDKFSDYAIVFKDTKNKTADLADKDKKPLNIATGKAAKTGDTGNIVLWILMLLASGGAVVILGRKKR